jgi:hypothetical protein
MKMKRGWVVAVAIALLAPIAAEGQSWKSVTMSRQLENSDEVHVAVEYGAGRFIVRSIDEDLLYRMNLRYDEDKYEPVADFTGDRLRLGVESNRGGVNIRGREAGELELELARGVPMDLELKFGAVQAEIDLGGLALTNLELSTGASESLVDISEPNPLQMNEAAGNVTQSWTSRWVSAPWNFSYRKAWVFGFGRTASWLPSIRKDSSSGATCMNRRTSLMRSIGS